MSVIGPPTFRSSRATERPASLRTPKSHEDGIARLLPTGGAEVVFPSFAEKREAVHSTQMIPPKVAAPSLPVPVASQQAGMIAATGGKLWLVSRSRGGVGATSFAVNLAVGLASSGAKSRNRVAIVDLDLQFGTVASSLDLRGRGGLLALAQLQDDPDAHAVRAALQMHPNGLSVLPAPEKPIPLSALDGPRIEAIVERLLESHDHVVIDLPPVLVEWLEPLLRMADRLFMVTDLAVTSLHCARGILDIFREDVPDLAVEVIVAAEKKPMFSTRIQREAGTALGAPLRHWLPVDPKRARLALDRGEPILSIAPYGAWARCIRKIVATLA